MIMYEWFMKERHFFSDDEWHTKCDDEFRKFGLDLERCRKIKMQTQDYYEFIVHKVSSVAINLNPIYTSMQML